MPGMKTRRPGGPDAWLAEEVFHLAVREGFWRVGLIASEQVWAEGHLQRRLAGHGLHCALPSIAERRELLDASELLDVDPATARDHLIAVARTLHERDGAHRVLVACPRYEKALASAEHERHLILGERLMMCAFQTHWHALLERNSL